LHADSGIKVSAHVPDLGVTDDVVRRRATIFFVWTAAFIALVALIGFVPAIAVFVCANMRFGFGEPWRTALGFAAATTLVCYVVFHWALAVAWPPSLLGELFPALRAATRLF
jgi:Tripartite tricarboxylate transporter TctB family